MLPDLQFAILDLNARYAQALDENRLEEWPGFFTASARYIVTTAENFEQQLPLGMIYATSRAMLQDRVRSLRLGQYLRGSALSTCRGPTAAGAHAGWCYASLHEFYSCPRNAQR